jgi:hypothetical protein
MVEYAPSSADVARDKENKANNITAAYPPGYYPAKLLAFYREKGPHPKIKALIHTCGTKLSSSEDSCLTERWQLEYKTFTRNVAKADGNIVKLTYRRPPIYSMDASCIRDRVYVVEETPGLRETLKSNDETSLVILVKDRKQWPKYFT